jgi:hypothetical protein
VIEQDCPEVGDHEYEVAVGTCEDHGAVELAIRRACREFLLSIWEGGVPANLPAALTALRQALSRVYDEAGG